MRKIIYVKPCLKDCYGDLDKPWYVEYKYRDAKTDKLKRFRIYEGLGNEGQTENERQRIAKKIIKEYSNKLEDGWNPFKPENKVYEDQLEYENIAKIYSRTKKTNNPIDLNFSEFLKIQKTKISHKTFQCYQSKVRLFYQYIKLKKLDEADVSVLDNKFIKEFFNYLFSKRKLDKLTAEKYKQIINSLFRYLLNEKLIHENPVYDIDIPTKKVDMSAQEILKEDRKPLLDAIKKNDPQLYLACLIQYYCALRPGNELRLLKINKLNFHSGIITIKSDDAKNNKTRIVQMPEALKKTFIELGIHNFNKDLYLFSKFGIPGKEPLGKNNLRNRFNRFRDSLGLNQDYKFYSWKHTGAGALDDINIPLRDIQEHLGHSSPEHTARYLKKKRGSKNNKIKYEFPKP